MFADNLLRFSISSNPKFRAKFTDKSLTTFSVSTRGICSHFANPPGVIGASSIGIAPGFVTAASCRSGSGRTRIDNALSSDFIYRMSNSLIFNFSLLVNDLLKFVYCLRRVYIDFSLFFNWRKCFVYGICFLLSFDFVPFNCKFDGFTGSVLNLSK